MKTLVLASQSPRRKELLERAGFRFRILSVKLSEFLEKNLTLEEALMTLARQKSEAALLELKSLKLDNFLVLTADTIVVLQDEVLGKPETADQAVEFLVKLSGKTHRVMTAVGLYDSQSERFVADVDSTKVEFRQLSKTEIEEYVKTGEPMDKAGAYAIQGLASKFVVRIVGSHDTVVGLPIKTVEKLLQENGWVVERVSS